MSTVRGGVGYVLSPLRECNQKESNRLDHGGDGAAQMKYKRGSTPHEKKRTNCYTRCCLTSLLFGYLHLCYLLLQETNSTPSIFTLLDVRL